MTGPLASQDEFGWTPERAHACVEGYRRAGAGWGSGLSLALWDRALDTPYNRRLVGMAERCSASMRVAADHVEFLLAQDGREIFPQIRVPARVICVTGHVYPAATTRAVADAIEGAEYHELPRSERGDSIGAAWRPITRHIAEVVRGAAALTGTPERVMTSVLFTDIVGSTDHLARVGDTAWTAVLTAHERLVRGEVGRTGGRLVRTIGDGTLCEFGGPAAAVRCAEALCAAAPDLGIEIRAGVHTGECERRGDDLAGIAVHIGARVSALAAAGEVLVSRTVCDLVAGSGLAFASRGTHELKGVPGRWEVFAAGTQPQAPSALAPAAPTRADRAVVALARRSPRTLRVANRLGNAIQRRRAARLASPARRRAP
jgi:class 3 adenylate cyclase